MWFALQGASSSLIFSFRTKEAAGSAQVLREYKKNLQYSVVQKTLLSCIAMTVRQRKAYTISDNGYTYMYFMTLWNEALLKITMVLSIYV